MNHLAAPSARRRFIRAAGAMGAGSLLSGLGSASAPGILIGADLEIRDLTSTSDDAILTGASLAVEDINRAGGLLGGRMLELVIRDNRSVPSRGVDNVREFVQTERMPAYLCGKFSPVTLEQVPIVHQHGLILLNPWSAADAIIDNGHSPNFAFRIGLRDSWAMEAILRRLAERDLGDIGLMLPASAWGRSSAAAIERLVISQPRLRIRGQAWHFWGGDIDIVASYRKLRQDGARAILLVANEPEGALLVRGIASMPREERLPIISHWGITGGDFATMCGPALAEVDLQVVQTHSFHTPRNPQARLLGERAAKITGVGAATRMPSAIGVAHAYDLVQLLALAISRAGSTDRAAVRDALERLPAHEGVIRRYAPAFTPDNHEGLRPSDLFFARFEADGRLLPSPG